MPGTHHRHTGDTSGTRWGHAWNTLRAHGDKPGPAVPWQEVNALQAQAASAGLTVEVDAPQAQDLGQALAELRAQYDVLAKKNLEELEKQWGQQVVLQS